MPTPPPLTPLDLHTPFGITHSGSLAGIWPRRRNLHPSSPQLDWWAEFGYCSSIVHQEWFGIPEAWAMTIIRPGWQWDSAPQSWYTTRNAVALAFVNEDPPGTFSWNFSGYIRPAAWYSLRLSPDTQGDPFPFDAAGPHTNVGGPVNVTTTLPAFRIQARPQTGGTWTTVSPRPFLLP